MIGQRAGGRGQASVGCCHGVGSVFCGVGVEVLEGLLALRHKLFERRQQQLGGRWPPVDATVERDDQALHLQGRRGGAPAVGGVGALGASGAPGGTGVQAAATARTSVHRLQEETVSGVTSRRTVGHEVLVVQEVLDVLVRRLLQLRHTHTLMISKH